MIVTLSEGLGRGLAREGQLVVYEHCGDWACADTYRDLEHLNHLWASGKAVWKV